MARKTTGKKTAAIKSVAPLAQINEYKLGGGSPSVSFALYGMKTDRLVAAALRAVNSALRDENIEAEFDHMQITISVEPHARHVVTGAAKFLWVNRK